MEEVQGAGDSPVSADPRVPGPGGRSRAAVYKRAYLERFPGANWEEFFKWDGVRVLHFAGRVRPHPKTGEMVRVVRRLYREVPDA